MKNIKKSASFFFMTLAITLPFSFSAQAFSHSQISILTAAAQNHFRNARGPSCPTEEPPIRDINEIDSCHKVCTIDADCGIGGSCNTGVCEYKTTYCLNDRWSVNERGETWNCDAYRCNTANGLCFDHATANDNCTAGYVFDGKASCVPSVNCAENDPSCQDIYQRWQKARHDYEAQTPQPTPNVFSCVSCQSNDECDTTQMCWQNRCTKADRYCSTNDDTSEQAVYDKNGLVTECGIYACNPIAKACFTQCQSKQDCQSGRACVAGTCQ